MLGSVASRAINAAAVGHANLRMLAAGNEESQVTAGHQLEDSVNQRIEYCCALLTDGGDGGGGASCPKMSTGLRINMIQFGVGGGSNKCRSGSGEDGRVRPTSLLLESGYMRDGRS